MTATDSVGNAATSEVEYYVESSPPAVHAQTFFVAWNASATLPVLNGVTVTDYALNPASVRVVSPPVEGTVFVNADGSVTYDNNELLTLENVEKTGSPDDSFSFTVSDVEGSVSAISTVTIDVLPQLQVSPSNLSLTQGVTLQQPEEQPTDVLGPVVGSTCGESALVLNGQAQGACGDLAPVTVTNDGASETGWSLTGQVSDFLDPSALPGTTCDQPASFNNLCIPGGDMGWSPTASVISVLSGFAAVVRPGPTINEASVSPGETALAPSLGSSISAPGSDVPAPDGLHAAPQILCESQASDSEGEFTCGAGLSLPVPASSAAPSGPGYQAALTLTLILS